MSSCIPLEKSLFCQEYKAYSISSIPHISSVSQLDNYISQNQAFSFGSTNCKSWPLANSTPITLSNSFSCAILLSQSQGCNPKEPPKSLCRASLEMTLEDVRAKLLSNCPAALKQAKFLGYEEHATRASNADCFLALGNDAGKFFSSLQLSL